MPASSLPSWQRPRPAGLPPGEGARAAESGWPGLPWPREGLPGRRRPRPGEGRGGAPTSRSEAMARDGSPAFPAGAAWWAVPGALVGIVLAGLGASIGYALTNSKTSAASDLLGEAGLWVAMLGTAVFVSRRFGTGSLARDYHLAIKPKDLVWGVVAVVGALVVVQGVLGVFAGTKFAGSNDEILTQQKGHERGARNRRVAGRPGRPFLRGAFLQRFPAHHFATSLRRPRRRVAAGGLFRAGSFWRGDHVGWAMYRWCWPCSASGSCSVTRRS